MKRLVASLSLICSITCAAIAQQLPDPSFDNWTGPKFNGALQLASWNGSNVKQTYMGITAYGTMVTQSTESHSGTYCAKIENARVEAMGIGENSPAWLTLGVPFADISNGISGATAGTYGGISFNFRPDTMAVWIRRTSQGNEDMNLVYYSWKGTSSGSKYLSKSDGCVTIATKTDEESDIRQATDKNECGTNQFATQVAEGFLRNRTNYATWTEVKVPIKYYNDLVPEKMNIILSAGNYPNKRATNVNLGSPMWVDDIRLIYSSAIHELYINNIKLASFKPEILEYTYTLGQNATTIPNIIAKRSGRTLTGNEITIIEGAIDGEPTRITVKAEDNSSTTTYSIYFVSKQSDNSRLNGIEYNNTPIPNFNGYNVGPYNVSLPFGTTQRPEVTVTKGEENQTYEISYNAETLPCTATIKVYAQNKINTSTYTVNFTAAQLSDNTLQNILVNGNAIEGFSPTKNNYTVELPQGTTSTPTITAISAYDEGAQTIVHTDNGLNGIYTIEVSAPGNAIKRTYKLTFIITASKNCSLQGINIGGAPLEGFSPNVTSYSYQLPQGTTTLPEITFTPGDEYQTITATSNGVEGKYTIKVTSQSGASKTYSINFTVFKSSISTLNDIRINGVSLADFATETTDYTYTLPIGTTAAPTIEYTKGEEHQTIVVVNGGINGTTYIRVLAEDGISSTTYRIEISVLKSNDANLIGITLNGQPLAGFQKEVLEYDYTLANDATVCPTIEVETEFPNQRVEIVTPPLNGQAIIKVFSESGESYNIYIINIDFEKSNNNYLRNILIDGVGITAFDKATTSYTVALTTEQCPTIQYIKDDEAQSVAIINNFESNQTITLLVTAADGSKRYYDIKCTIPLSGNALLSDIKLYDNNLQRYVSLPSFSPSTFDYTQTLVWRTTTAPNIHPVAGQKGQTIRIEYNTPNDTTTLLVTAENGTTQRYHIYFPVEKSSYNQLANIVVENAELNFDADTLNYHVTLPYGTTQVPNIEWEKQVEEQNIDFVKRGINDTTLLVVTAEDGTQRTYTLSFEVAPSMQANTLQSIIVEGVGAFTGDATINLPYGTEQLPTISYVKNYPEQTVIIENGGVLHPTTITVIANEAGVENTVYTLTPVVASPTAALNSISVNGVAIGNFDPQKHAYVVDVNTPVGEQPTVEYTHSDEVVVETVVENTKNVQLRVSTLDNTQSAEYNIYFYYPSDVIPNGEFTEWTKAVYNNANKPLGWNVPADKADDYQILFVHARTGGEVVKHSESVVGFKTVYFSNLMGPIPALATIGDISCELKAADGTTVAFSGGIPYRNTPDEAVMNYYYKYKKGNGALFAFRFFDDSEHNADYLTTTTNDDYTEYRHPLNTSALAPTQMNIAINATNQFVGGNSGAELYVDYIRFEHNSAIDNVVIDNTSNAVATNYDIDADYQGIPTIAAIGQVPDQEHTITIAPNETEEAGIMKRLVNILSKAEDGTTTTYAFHLNRPKSSNCQLSGITIEGTPIADFVPATLTYNYTVANGTTRTPSIEVKRGSIHQSIAIHTNGIAPTTIEVTAENGNKQTYTINFVESKSNVSTLNNININGVTSFVFDPITTEYDVVVAHDAALPAVTFEKASDNQVVTLHHSKQTTIKVVAENGVDETTYTINFVPEAVETSAELLSIAHNGETIEAFAPTTLRYEVTKQHDNSLTYTKAFATDSLTATLFADSALLALTNKSIEKQYCVVFNKEVSANAFLDNIFVNGSALNDFSRDSFNYTIVADTIPEVSVEGNDGQTINITATEEHITIVVTAENGNTFNIYTIDIVSTKPRSTNAYLNNIAIDGTPLADFEPTKLNYSYELPMHSTLLPTIAAFAGDANQTIQITTNGTNGTTYIRVEAENGDTLIYTIDFSVTPCNDSQLTNIMIAGEPIATDATGFEADVNFAPTQTVYNILLPKEQTTLPAITYTSAHSECQTITRDTLTNADGSYTVNIIVIAEDNISSTTYTLNISRQKSDNALLEMIFVDGEEVENFSENTFEYTVHLPYGTTQVPDVTIEQQEAAQTVVITPAATLGDSTTITVTAEDNLTQARYIVTYEVLPSNNASLSGIYLNGELIAPEATAFECDTQFDSEVFEYYVALPTGSTSLPTITWTTSVPDITSATITTNGVNGIATITVVAQDGVTTLDYVIHFTVQLSSNSHLADLMVEGVSIGSQQENYEVYFGNYELGNIATQFTPDSTVYTLVYPVGTDTTQLIDASDVEYVLAEASQSATIRQNSATEILIEVTAENGSKSFYVVRMVIVLSSNSLLKDILIDGFSIDDFEPTTLNYTYLLHQGDTIPTIIPVKQEDRQLVSIITKSIGEETIITCQAEDLSTTEYRILFKFSTENIGDDPTANDVCWTALGNGQWKASAKRSNVYVYIFNPHGMMIDMQKVPVLNPNSELCSKDSNGAIFHFEKKGQVYIYLFTHEANKRITSGKILY